VIRQDEKPVLAPSAVFAQVESSGGTEGGQYGSLGPFSQSNRALYIGRQHQFRLFPGFHTWLLLQKW
jgi:hypothetical protein